MVGIDLLYILCILHFWPQMPCLEHNSNMWQKVHYFVYRMDIQDMNYKTLVLTVVDKNQPNIRNTTLSHLGVDTYPVDSQYIQRIAENMHIDHLRKLYTTRLLI